MNKPMSKKQTQDRKGKMMIGGVALVSLILFGVFAMLSKPALPVGLDGCPLDERGVSGEFTVLVDPSDPLTKYQQRAVDKVIDKLKMELKPEEHVTVYRLTEEKTEVLAAMFDGCSPDNGKEANQLYENPERIRQGYEKSFAKPLREQFKKIDLNSEMATSPIIEAIELAGLRMKESNVQHKRLVILSDMLQNSSLGSHYRQRALDPNKANAIIQGKLEGVEVQVIYLYNGKNRGLQSPAHQRFWRAFFKAGGAKSVQISVV